ncbi:prenyl cysteine carboxyl methyltransferase ste14 [Grosmannia clavigera kw1407]|uniref:Protein-S-isoprenylcysteine O-methyltransferase n=1 Tax=Grosmannia clavigera (strain kw1407 / UAMH 11150) TaxID=655863 RepID=F0XNJ9_GROCL|nr:prenyl cysteine carboxyl methyltransferase ste14 [Grosmannia clavigera kw1407]EFX00549.1 prenyl cysteine carboxyl methyltransferase ste14 [Grosmannia clavigera kw1407]
MSAATSLSQAALAATVLASTVGTYVALSPPHVGKASPPTTTGDALQRLHLASQNTTNAVVAPLGLLSLHTAGLALCYPAVLRHPGGRLASVASGCITWSPATTLSLALILCLGIPLRLCSYASLGTSFTFVLAQPDRLITTGLYRYLQHPSYVGVQVLLVGNAALLCRTDGVLACWIPPAWHRSATTLAWTLATVAVSALAWAGRLRVRQEEQMLRAKFSADWEKWHAATARFIPFLI